MGNQDTYCYVYNPCSLFHFLRKGMLPLQPKLKVCINDTQKCSICVKKILSCRSQYFNLNTHAKGLTSLITFHRNTTSILLTILTQSNTLRILRPISDKLYGTQTVRSIPHVSLKKAVQYKGMVDLKQYILKMHKWSEQTFTKVDMQDMGLYFGRTGPMRP